MKKFKLLLIIGLLALTQCCNQAPKEKPFVIVGMEYGNNISRYEYQDAKGNTQWFSDKIDKYSIGDTIK